MAKILSKSGVVLFENEEADLRNANLSGANLYGADLYGANLYNANLYNANLYNASLRHASLHHASLRHANLYNANLYGADLCNADLYDADLYGADLYGAVGCCDAGTDHRGYCFVGVQHTDGWRVKAGCRWFTIPEAIAHWTAKDNQDALARVAVIIAQKG